MRVLYFDRSGFCIWAKRLEAGRFLSDWAQVRTREMDWTALKLMLEGIELGQAAQAVSATEARYKSRFPTLHRTLLLRYNAPMEPAPPTKLPSEAEMALLQPGAVHQIVRSGANARGTRVPSPCRAQLEWFQRQMFGTKSERLRVLENAQQLALGEVLAPPAARQVPAKERLVAAHTRRERSGMPPRCGEAESVPFFDESRVPVETIELPDPQIEGLSPDQYEVIGQKVSYRLAQRPGSYVILKYLRSVIKRRDTQSDQLRARPGGCD